MAAIEHNTCNQYMNIELYVTSCLIVDSHMAS
jgi:hypothetical protein